MKKIAAFFALALNTLSLYAQESPPQVPPIKQPINIKTPTLPKQPIKIAGGPVALPPKPNTLAFMLTSHAWTLIRWWVTPTAGHSITDIAFRFMADNSISCHLITPEASTVLQSGTYSINGNNVTIILKKDANVTMTCNVVYNSSDQTLTGTYSLVVLPITNPPSGYTAGTVNGNMKLGITP